ncbi:MAG: ATP-binding cassette domain-containing protein [Pseudomonadota bacterium]|nr:ATP-binding cassette domain-containing protein [Pseudomonadota bacterium]
MDAIVVANNLTRQVDAPGGKLTILRGVNISVATGEAVAITGASGSGKSTLLGQLAGFDGPTTGTVHLLGNDLAQLSEDGKAALRAGNVGFVFQAFHLLASLSALENVMLALEIAGQNQQETIARSTLTEVGLADRLHHFPRQLSGGEQQRVALARAFAVSPRILFADEPTGNLDAENGAQVADVLFKLRHNRGTALVLVTHDEHLAGRCDRVCRMRAGEISSL